ncbi:bifunctional enoyl-CoA hydratase/phosphate acetyltransferase [Hujiaoplasma nucleasis]|uniref:Bifunctional enoyl-CoA hydratase/phosphate acetyltransferase n=1 Tax=Hujiaoplasma nucleasis TaxID=2725268 RepID=A0A7L6N0W5_9MOLU|nr:bifunctional enoyl-CoA hydratase/phosphate acetyltransferase [Hujiaoplasma nucleasis]QLY39900.1 bifunctional enoyl-CoA hydratase/phosphate acetyltransferase [Hujiaoplasma nucleasis]
MLKSVAELAKLAEKVNRKKMAVVFAHDDHVIEAVYGASKQGFIEPVLIGDQVEIEKLISKYHLQKPYQIIHEMDPSKASLIAMNLVNQGQCDIVMKGLIDTKLILKEVVNSDTGIKKAHLLSHVGVVSLPTYPKVIFATDGAMNINPNVEQKIEIIEAAVELARTLGYKEPKVGLVSAVEKVNSKIESTLHAQEIVNYYKDKDIDFLIDGPFAIDNLVSDESVKQKGIESEVAGDCDIMIFPNLDGGNIFYKTCMFLAGGKSAGIILGAKVPIVLTSRADTAEAKLNSIILAVVNANGLSNFSD